VGGGDGGGSPGGGEGLSQNYQCFSRDITQTHDRLGENKLQCGGGQRAKKGGGDVKLLTCCSKQQPALCACVLLLSSVDQEMCGWHVSY
jgi:hypothetical protein